MNGRTRIYALSMDLDGVIRIWEAFQGNRSDNGHEVPWEIESRTHPVQETVFDYAVFRFFRLLLDQIVGNVSITGQWRGLRGQYHPLLDTKITATPGSIFVPIDPYKTVDYGTSVQSFREQTRQINSPNANMGPPSDCQAAGVESPFEDGIDRAFSLRLGITGRAALVAYRIACDSYTQDIQGEVVDPESGFNIIPESGCPQHIDGVTPDYLSPDTNPRDAFVNIIPIFAEDDSYQAPVN